MAWLGSPCARPQVAIAAASTTQRCEAARPSKAAPIRFLRAIYHRQGCGPDHRIITDARLEWLGELGYSRTAVTVSPHLAPRQRETGALGAAMAGHKSCVPGTSQF